MSEVKVEIIIETALTEGNVTNKIIVGLQQSYLPLTIKGQDDVEGYKAVVAARKDCKGWRIKAKEICKSGREEAVNIQKAWIAKEKEVVGKIEEVESYLEKMEDEYEAERDRLKAEADAARELVAANRYSDLLKLGATTDGINYILGDVSYETLVIKGADADIYTNTILPKYKEVFDKVEAEKAELARIEAEQKAALEAEKAELEWQQKEFQEQQEAEKAELEWQQKEFQEQQEAFAKKQAEAARVENERLQREADAKEKELAETKRKEKERIDTIFRERFLKLKGWLYNGFTLSKPNGETYGHAEDLINLSDAHFETLVKVNESFLEQQYKEAEEKKQSEIKLAQEKAVQAEKERIANEQKAAKDKEAADALLEQERIANAKDKELWAEVLKYLDKTPQFDFRSSQYRTKAKFLRDFLSDIKEK